MVHYNGAKKVKNELNVNLFAEAMPPRVSSSISLSGHYTKLVKDLQSKESLDFIWLVGFLFSDSSLSLAYDYPNFKYAVAVGSVYNDGVVIPVNLV